MTDGRFEHRWSARIEPLQPSLTPQGADGHMINITDDLIWEQQDQLQRIERKLDRLCEQAGIDPGEAGRLPDHPPGSARAA